MLELPRLKAVWKALTKKRSLAKTIKSRELKAKTPIGCPYCVKGEHKESIPPPSPTLIPYNQTKSKRGRKIIILPARARACASGWKNLYRERANRI
jgi:hypothetical protein